MDKKIARLIVENDLPVLAGWWGYYHKTDYPISFLSPLGVCVEDESGLMAAGFIYPLQTIGGVNSYADYCIVNPELPKVKRQGAIESLMDAMIYTSKSLGHGVMIANAAIPKLINRMKAKGFDVLADAKLMGVALNG